MSFIKKKRKSKSSCLDFFSYFFVNTVTDTLKGSTLMTTGISSNFHFYFKQSVSSRKTAVWVSQLKVQCLQFAHKAVLYSKSCSIPQKVKHLLQTLYNPWDEPKVKRKISKSREILKFQNSFDQPRKVQHPNNF